MNMCHAFEQNGHNVNLILPIANRNMEVCKSAFSYYGIPPCFSIHRIPYPHVRFGSYMFSLAAAYKAKALHSDIVYGRDLAACYFSSLHSIPVIYEAHCPIEEMGRTISPFLFKSLLSHSSFLHLVVISDALKNHFEDAYPSLNDRIVVAHDGAKLSTTSQDVYKMHSYTPNTLNIGYIGHLYSGRGIELIAKLAFSCPWANFHIVGGNEADIEYWNRELNALTNLHLHGFVQPREAAMYCNSFDILLAPYQTTVSVFKSKRNTVAWMSPLKLFEYMASGRPIICSDLPVLREILTHNKTALLCRPDNIAEWIGSIQYLADNPRFRNQLGHQAKVEFLAKYTWSARAKAVLPRDLSFNTTPNTHILSSEALKASSFN
jgi:glycosyltransferase involved in cell wall biosynthesis